MNEPNVLTDGDLQWIFIAESDTVLIPVTVQAGPSTVRLSIPLASVTLDVVEEAVVTAVGQIPGVGALVKLVQSGFGKACSDYYDHLASMNKVEDRILKVSVTMNYFTEPEPEPPPETRIILDDNLVEHLVPALGDDEML